MALPTNDDFPNCELSTEELDAIAAGWPSWVHSIEHGLKSFFTNKYVVGAGALFVAAGALFTGASNTKLQ